MTKFQTFTSYLAVFITGGLIVGAYDHMVYRIKERAAISVVNSATQSTKEVVGLIKRKCE